MINAPEQAHIWYGQALLLLLGKIARSYALEMAYSYVFILLCLFLITN